MPEKEKIESVEKAREEVIRRNVESAVAHSNESRKIIRKVQNELNELKNLIIQQNSIIEEQNNKINNLLINAYNGKPTT